MKALVVKFGMILIFLAFVFYVIIALMGCLSCVFGASESYYCTTYCMAVKISALVVLVAWMAWFIYSIVRYKKNV